MPNEKVSQKPSITTPTSDDLVYLVNDPAGTPTSGQSSLTNLTKGIPALVGDSGSGGTKGLAPAPGAGDAAANKFLHADGTYKAVAGAGGIGGSTGSTDNAIIRADGTGGVTIQSSALTLDDNGGLTFPEISAPSTPASAKVVLYAKSDGLLYSKDDAGLETVVTGGAGGGGSPGGSDTQVQFNDSSSFGGDADLTWNKTTNTLSLSNGGSAAPVLTTTNDGTIKVANLLALLGSGSTAQLRLGKDSFIQWTDNSSYASGTLRIELTKNATPGFLNLTSGSFDTVGWLLQQGEVRCTSNFAKTTDTTLANITGVTQALTVDGSGGYSNGGISGNYSFEFEADVDADATGGYKFAVAYSASVTAIAYTIQFIANGTPGTIDLASRQTASGGSAGAAGATAGRVRIAGSITVGANGNLTVQFAQNVSNGTSTVLTNGSFLHVKSILR